MFEQTRFKVTIFGVVLCFIITIISFIVKENTIGTIATSGIPTIIIAYITGNSIRKSENGALQTDTEVMG